MNVVAVIVCPNNGLRQNRADQVPAGSNSHQDRAHEFCRRLLNPSRPPAKAPLRVPPQRVANAERTALLFLRWKRGESSMSVTLRKGGD